MIAAALREVFRRERFAERRAAYVAGYRARPETVREIGEAASLASWAFDEDVWE